MIPDKNQLFPVFFKLNELRVLLVGGGQVGLEKTKAILANSPLCQLTIVAKEISDELKNYTSSFSTVKLIEKSFEPTDINNHQLIIGAVDDKETSSYVKRIAKENKILCNIADQPELCDFYLGSIVTKGDLKIAISTNGKSPTIAKRLKEIFNEHIPKEIDESLENLSRIRNHLSGDFKKKVEKLNEITSTLKHSSKKEWYNISTRKLAFNILTVLAIMIAGHVVFSLIPTSVIALHLKNVIATIDINFLYYMAGGFIAQMIDGALGMAYGVSATTFLLSLGISPAVASMSVHSSEIFTSGVSGFMHLRFGNVNTKLFKTLLIPGVIGAILGAYILSEFEKYNGYIKPFVGVYTLLLGAIIIYKVIKKNKKRKKVKRIGWLATTGGFLDAIGGGGWGPVVSSTLIASGKNPRIIIGSVNLTEFFVSVASSFTFITLIGISHWQVIVGLILGGTCAAPIAAYVSNKLPIKTMMILVGVVVIIVSLRIIIISLV